MFRRCISLLVIMGLFASQLAAIPHAHAGNSAEEQQKHDATPHFHSEWFRSGHDHGHSHDGHSHSHDGQHAEKNTPQPAGDSEDQPLSDGLNGTDHDANAVFVPLHAGAPSTTSQNVSKAAASQIAATAVLTEVFGDAWPSVSSTPPLHPPDAVQDGSDIYLTLRNLRI